MDENAVRFLSLYFQMYRFTPSMPCTVSDMLVCVSLAWHPRPRVTTHRTSYSLRSHNPSCLFTHSRCTRRAEVACHGQLYRPASRETCPVILILKLLIWSKEIHVFNFLSVYSVFSKTVSLSQFKLDVVTVRIFLILKNNLMFRNIRPVFHTSFAEDEIKVW